MMLVDYHVHPDYSIDSIGSMKDYADAAIRKGISEICFTTHLNLVPERTTKDGYIYKNGQLISVRDSWIEGYIQEVKDLDNIFRKKGLQIMAGVEIDYHPDIEDEIAKIISTYPFDYVLGAVHSLDGHSIAVPEDCHIYCREKTPQELCRVYFELVDHAVRSKLFDAIAHLDLYKRFSYALYGNVIDTAHLPYWDQVLDAFASVGTGIEINTGNWRKGLLDASPSIDQLIDLFCCGVSVLTVGSDAHDPEFIGCDILRAYERAHSAGFKNIYRFRNRIPEIAVNLPEIRELAEEGETF